VNINWRDFRVHFVATFAAIVVSGTPAIACNIDPQVNVKLDPKDRAVLSSLGKAINAQELLDGSPAAMIFSEPGEGLTLSASDSKALAQSLAGLRKAVACHADTLMMERILEDDTPGIRFLRQIEGCLADACVDNQ
jgi:hypothetical protein